MGFHEAVGSCLRQFFRLRGRATRAEYFWFVLFTVLLQGCAKLVSAAARFINHSTMGYIQTLGGQVKLHDTGRTGWWALASNVAVVLGMGMGIGATRAPQPGVAIFMVVVGLGVFVVPLAVFLFTLQPGDSNYKKFDYG